MSHFNLLLFMLVYCLFVIVFSCDFAALSLYVLFLVHIFREHAHRGEFIDLKHVLNLASSLHRLEFYGGNFLRYIDYWFILHTVFYTFLSEVELVEEIAKQVYKLGLQHAYNDMNKVLNAIYVCFYGVGDLKTNLREERGNDKIKGVPTLDELGVEAYLAHVKLKEVSFIIGLNMQGCWLRGAFEFELVFGLEVQIVQVTFLGQGLYYWLRIKFTYKEGPKE